MNIQNIKVSDSYAFTIILDDGTELALPSSMAGIIKENMLMQELRCGISDIVDDEINGGYIDMGKYNGTQAEFEGEIFDELSDDISNGDYTALCNDGDYIREKVTDLADWYELEPDEDDEEEEK